MVEGQKEGLSPLVCLNKAVAELLEICEKGWMGTYQTSMICGELNVPLLRYSPKGHLLIRSRKAASRKARVAPWVRLRVLLSRSDANYLLAVLDLALTRVVV